MDTESHLTNTDTLAPDRTLKDVAETPVLPRIAGIQSNGNSSAELNDDGSLGIEFRVYVGDEVIPTVRKWRFIKSLRALLAVAGPCRPEDPQRL